MGSRIDWSKAGVRLRHTPKTAETGWRNSDWNDPAQRWKTAEEYAGEELTGPEVQAKVPCPRDGCYSLRGESCRDTRGAPMIDAPHSERRAAAGQARIDAGEFAL